MSAANWLGADPDLPLTALDLALAQFLQTAQPSMDVRHGWLAALVSHQFGRGHACLDLEVLRHSGVLALGWEARCQTALPADLAQAADSLPWTDGPSSPLVLEGARLYLRRNWQAEQTIRTSILARLAQPCTEPEGLAQALDSLFAPAPVLAAVPPDQPLPADTPGMTAMSAFQAPALQAPAATATAPDWQKVACAIATRGRFTLITGGPGTGKTTTVVRLLALLQSQADRPLRMALAAPTGKAAARLGESIAQAVKKLPASMQAHIPAQAQTLHKLLQVRAAVLATPAPELALDLVVVDEASMIDLELMARLMQAVPLSASLILLGDKDQLASVEAGAVMGQLCAGAQAGGYSAATTDWVQQITGQDVSAWRGTGSILAQHTVMLRHSHRFAAGSPIGQWASAVNAGDRAAVAELWAATPLWRPASDVSVTRLPSGAQPGSSLGALVQSGWQPLQAALPAPDGEAASSDAQALTLLQVLGRFQVLCALREGPWGVLALNRLIARALGFPLEGWYAGRPVMVTRNDYNLGLMNGDIGLCLPSARGLRVAFVTNQDDAAGVRWVLPSRLDAVETVFAMTVHKSQGSEFDQVALVLPDRMAPVLTRELLYTGITRAKQRLSLVVPQAGVLRQAVASHVLRSGGLTPNSAARSTPLLFKVSK